MSEQSKEVDPQVEAEVITELNGANGGEKNKHQATMEKDTEDADDTVADVTATSSMSKKKKSKKSKLKQVLGAREDVKPEEAPTSLSPARKLTPGMIEQLLEMNPSLKSEVEGMDKEQAAERLKKLDVADLLTGMASLSVSGKNQKDMASYKFWQTQPVPRFDETEEAVEGPIKIIDPEQVPKEPRPLYEGFEWVTMDLMQDKELEEVYELLMGHYVEDDEAMFRFNYSMAFLNWALKSPGWRKEWHVGVRATQSKKLVAFISGVPVDLRIRSKIIKTTEINYLCVHKKLRSKRLAPVLIQEITRRCYLFNIYQAIYTVGVVLPKPVSTCRYFHRSLDWLKLYEVKFAGLPVKSTKARQITKFRLPSSTSTPGLRHMQLRDVDGVHDLLGRYLKRFQMAPEFSRDEIKHWFFHDEKSPSEQVIFTYVVEDSSTSKITDFFSFFCLESSVIGNPKHDMVRAAYLFYYATETAFEVDERGLKERLNVLITDACILAKKRNFDVLNALTLLDNPLFLESQKFMPGDGQLHYYLYNYRVSSSLPGGVDHKNQVDPDRRGGVGVVML